MLPVVLSYCGVDPEERAVPVDDTATGRPTTVASFDGANGDAPMGGLLVHDGYVYGTTRFGGSNGGGTLFRVAIPKPRRRLVS